MQMDLLCLYCVGYRLVLGLHPTKERRRYFLTPSLIGWVQAWNQPWVLYVVIVVPIVVAEEGRDPLRFIVFISSTSLDARKGTKYDNVQKEAWWN